MGRILLYLWISLEEEEVYQSEGTFQQILAFIYDVELTRQKFSLALLLEVSTPRSPSFFLSLLVIVDGGERRQRR